MPLANEFARLRREASFGNFEKIGTTAAGKYFFASAFSLFAGDSPHILLVRYRLAGNGRYYLHSMKLVHRTSEVLELLSPLGLLKKME